MYIQLVYMYIVHVLCISTCALHNLTSTANLLTGVGIEVDLWYGIGTRRLRGGLQFIHIVAHVYTCTVHVHVAHADHVMYLYIIYSTM